MTRRHALAMTLRAGDPRRLARLRGETFYPSFNRRLGAAPEVHTRESMRLMQSLRRACGGDPPVHVSGCVPIYHDAAHPRRSVTPDVYAVVGVSLEDRPGAYRLWEGAPAPAFVIEIAYAETRYDDQYRKPSIYAGMGVRELVYYDPLGDHLSPPLQVYVLDGSTYRPKERAGASGYDSSVFPLHLDLVDGRLQISAFNRSLGNTLAGTCADSEAAYQQAALGYPGGHEELVCGGLGTNGTSRPRRLRRNRHAR